jgi:hypothetical protein
MHRRLLLIFALGSLALAAARWTSLARAAGDPLLDGPLLTLPGAKPEGLSLLPETNTAPVLKVNPTLVPSLAPPPAPEPSVTGARGGLVGVPSPLVIGGNAPSTNTAVVAPPPALAHAPAAAPNGLLLRIEPAAAPAPPPKTDEDEDDAPTPRAAPPPAATLGPTAQHMAGTAPPLRGSFLDRIISGRTRSYALTNVTASATNSVWRPLYNTEPDLRDYHPQERPEHVPAEEDANRERIR